MALIYVFSIEYIFSISPTALNFCSLFVFLHGQRAHILNKKYFNVILENSYILSCLVYSHVDFPYESCSVSSETDDVYTNCMSVE